MLHSLYNASALMPQIDPETGGSYTFTKLQEEAECLAGHLLDLGVKPHDVVTFYSTNCLEYVIMLLAVWRVGGITAVLNAMALASKINT